MKKLIILMIILLALPSCKSYKQAVQRAVEKALTPPKYNLYCSIRGVSTGGPHFESEYFRIDFDWSSFSPKKLNVEIINKTKERITVEWENFRLNDRHIFFSSDNEYNYANPKADEVIFAGGTVKKTILMRGEYIHDIFNERYVKEGSKSVASVIIPIRLPSGETKDYQLYLTLAPPK